MAKNKPLYSAAWIYCGLLSLIAILIAWPNHTSFLWEFDSVNYALALERYDIASYSPHPPGYLFYVVLARGVNTLLHDPNETLWLIGLSAIIGTLWLVYALGTGIAGRDVGVVSAVLTLFNPVIWFYAQVGTIYPFEALGGISVAYASYRLFQGNRRWLLPSALLLGLVGGLRGFLVPFLFPLWLYCTWHGTRSFRALVLGAATSGVGIACWYIPTVWLAGGIGAYRESSQIVLDFIMTKTSIFTINPLEHFAVNLLVITVFTAAGLGFFGLVALLSLSLRRARSWFRSPEGPWAMRWFFLLWTLPAALFYLTIHIPKPGYILTFLPGWQVLVGWTLVASYRWYDSKSPRYTMGVATGCLLAIHITMTILLHFTFTQPRVIKYNNHLLANVLSAVDGPDCREPESCLIVAYTPWWRHVQYYRPDFRMVRLVDEESFRLKGYGAETIFTRYRRWAFGTAPYLQLAERPPTQTIPIEKDVKTIFWIVNREKTFYQTLRDKLRPREVPLKPSLKDIAILSTSRPNLSLPIQVGAFRFVDASKKQTPWPNAPQPDETSQR